MKKFFGFIMLLVLSITSFAAIEISGAANYTKNLERGEDQFSRERIRVAYLHELPGKFNKVDALIGVEYQIKDDENKEAYVPQLGVRYYPFDFITAHVGTTLGGEITTSTGFEMSPVLEVNMGLGRREVLLQGFAGINDTSDGFAGVRVGYVF